MDNIKDNNELEAKSITGTFPIISIYRVDKANDSIRDKIERLSAVVYLATNHINDIDPIKLSVREVCLNCLKTVNDTNIVVGEANMSSRLSEILVSDLSKISSFLRVLSISGFMSKNNFEVINNAISTILNNSFSKEEFSFSKDDQKIVEKTQNVNLKNSSESVEKVKTKSLNLPEKSGRSERVLSLIKKQGKVATKDIVDYFPGVSDKTIQRELNKLVSEGKIQRQGKKRWSFYSISGV